MTHDASKNFKILTGVLDTTSGFATKANQIGPYLKANDIFAYPIAKQTEATALKAAVSGLKLATGGTDLTIAPLNNIAGMTSDVDYVTYDFELSACPQFTTNFTTAMATWDTFTADCHANGKLSVITPVYIENPTWDWGLAATHCDIMQMQIQNYQTNVLLPLAILPSQTGVSISQICDTLVNAVRAQSATSKIYFQIGFAYTSSSRCLKKDGFVVTGETPDGLCIWYNNTEAQWTNLLDTVTYYRSE